MRDVTRNEDLRATWFGKVSPRWKLGRAKNAFQLVSKKVGPRSSEYELLSLTLKGIIPRDVESGKGKFPESFDTYQEVKKSDIVFCLFDIDETPRTVGLSPIDGMVTGAYTVVRCTNLADPRYVTYFYLSVDERKGLRPFYTGLRKVVRTETFLNAVFPLPDLPTQRRIADFLDRETARIDRLIEKKQRLVELLGEKRSAVITAAVTGVRFNGSVEIDSCSNDFVTRPHHVSSSWDRQKIKYHLSGFFGGGTPSKGVEAFWADGTVPWVSPKDMKRRFIDTAEDKITVAAVQNSSTNMVPIGSVLMVVRSGILKHSLPVALNIVPVALNQDMKAFRFRSSLLPEFFTYWVEGQQRQRLLEWCQIGATVDNIDIVEMLNAKIASPPPDIQRQITDCLDRETKRIDEIISKTNTSITRLKEYRSALITAAVTGQIDVDTYGKSGAADRRLDAIQEEMQA